jgi:hypothetical protein
MPWRRGMVSPTAESTFHKREEAKEQMTNMAGASLQCVAIRVTALNFDGTPAAGNPMYVSDQLVKIDFNPDIESGIEVSNRGASGNLCVVYRTPDLLKRLTIEVELCVPDPELEVLLSGGRVYYDETDVTAVMGFEYPKLMTDPTPNGVSIEAWTRYIVEGSQPPDQPYMRWVFPRMYLHKGNRTIDINSMASVFDGFAIENLAWEDGPIDDWPYGSDAVVMTMFDDQIPEVQVGIQKVPGNVATGATAGSPGTFTPAGSAPPANLAAMSTVTASPTTAWTTGQSVVLGDSSNAHWDGAAWATGIAP